jgi:TetR/AcrR family transcriptional regulator
MRPVPDSIAERLIGAATVFAERGFEGTRIDDVAEATGVPRATLYYYFAGKEDLLAWLLKSMLDVVAVAVAEVTEGPGDARSRLEAVVRTQLEIMAAHPSACLALVANFGRAGRIPEISMTVHAGFHQAIQRLLEEGAADGSLRAVEDPMTLASSIYGAVIMPGLHCLVVDGRLDPGPLATQVCALVISGLEPAAAPTPRRAAAAR